MHRRNFLKALASVVSALTFGKVVFAEPKSFVPVGFVPEPFPGYVRDYTHWHIEQDGMSGTVRLRDRRIEPRPVHWLKLLATRCNSFFMDDGMTIDVQPVYSVVEGDVFEWSAHFRVRQ